MRKEILSEIDQMKYLFGYKAGKVISEQAVPTTQSQKSPYKLEVIKNDEDFKNFLSLARDTTAWKNVGLGNKFDVIQKDVNQKLKGDVDTETITKQGQRISASHDIITSIIKSLLVYSAMNGKNGQMINQLPDATLLKMIDLYMTPEEKQKVKGVPIENYIESFIGDIPTLKSGVSKLIDNKIKELGGQPQL